MKTENNRQHTAEEGKTFRRISNGFIIGNGLGNNNSIENYKEVDSNVNQTNQTVYQSADTQMITV